MNCLRTNDEILKFESIKLVLKNDLGYALEDIEKKRLMEMNPADLEAIRRAILDMIASQNLSLDVLEDYLMELKNHEYQRYLLHEGMMEGDSLRYEKLVELEGKCTQMVINIANGMSDSSNLLGPSVHDTYGISAKR